MSKVKKQIEYNSGQLGWTLWAAFGRVLQDPQQIMNYDQALRSLLPGCSDYDLILLTSTVVPDMRSLLGTSLKFEEREVLLHARERVLEEMRRREIPITSTVDEVIGG